jgi:uncharacterized membrane protein
LIWSAVPVAAGLVRLSQLAGAEITADNARFIAVPGPVVLHILCATLFCVLGAFQFDTALRHRYPKGHRLSGRVAAPCGILAALSGLWMTAAYPIPAALQGGLLYGARFAAGASMALALVLSVRAVLQGRIDAHRAWMVRAYALGQGAGTQVLMLLPLSLMAGAPTCFLRDVLMASAWGLNLVVAEWLIRRRPFSTSTH